MGRFYFGLHRTGGWQGRLRQPAESAVSGSATAPDRPGPAAALPVQVEIGLAVVNGHPLDERFVREEAQEKNDGCQQK